MRLGLGGKAKGKNRSAKIFGLVSIPFLLILLITYLFKTSTATPVSAASETHLCALIEVITPLSIDQKILIRDRLLELTKQSDSLPSGITLIGRSLDNQKVIIEVVMPERITKAQVVSKLAESLPWSEATIDANTNITVFRSLRATWEENLKEAVSYLISYREEWETSK